MLSTLRLQIEEIVKISVSEVLKNTSVVLPAIELEKTKEKTHGDFSCNVSLRLAKDLKKNPLEIAQAILAILHQKIKASPLNSVIVKFEIIRTGFINFYLKPKDFFPVLSEVLKKS